MFFAYIAKKAQFDSLELKLADFSYITVIKVLKNIVKGKIQKYS